MNKKGFFPAIGITLTVGTLIVIGVIIALLMVGTGIFLNFITKNIFAIVGATLLIFSFILLSKKAVSQKFAGILIVISVLLILLQFSGIAQTFAPTFTPVYCNDYEFTCCNYNTGIISSIKLSSTIAYVCPYEKCHISLDGTTYARAGSKNCRIESNILGAKYYVCDDGYSIKSTTATLNKNYQIWIDYGATQRTMSGNYEYYALGFCGTGACSQGTHGVPVPGAVRCAFTSKKTIYEKGGQLIGVSYVVPDRDCVLSWAGKRYICGNLEEKCSNDADCSGHTYGNKECYARTLQTYGCKQLSLPSGVGSIAGELIGDNRLPGLTAPSYSGVKSRCEIIKAVPVQCCGDTDCGSSFVCDKTSFTCKEASQAPCTKDYDCGVSVQCDYNIKQLKTPKCASGKCGYSTTTVECCYDINCPTGYYCDASKKCQKSTMTKQPCPFTCCIGESQYIDKPCADKPYCNNHVCSNIAPDPGVGEGGACTDKFFGLVPSQLVTVTTTKQTFWSVVTFGLIKGETTTTPQCKYDYTLFIMIIGGIIVVVAMILLLKPGKSTSKIKYVYRRRK